MKFRGGTLWISMNLWEGEYRWDSETLSLYSTRPHSDEFCNLILDYNLRQNHPPFFSIKNNNSINTPLPPLQCCFSCGFCSLPVHQHCSEKGGGKTKRGNTKVLNSVIQLNCQFYASVPKIFIEDCTVYTNKTLSFLGLVDLSKSFAAFSGAKDFYHLQRAKFTGGKINW